MFLLMLILSTGLIAFVKPILGQILLPVFGGSATTWMFCLVAFQSFFGLGALYAFLLHRIGRSQERIIHTIVLIVSLVSVCYAFFASNAELSNESPLWSLMQYILSAVGLPLLIMTSSSILAQQHVWASKQSEDPYYLYGISHIGTVSALCLYPLVDTFLNTGAQKILWISLYAAFLLLNFKSIVLDDKPVKASINHEPVGKYNLFGIAVDLRLFWGLVGFSTSGLLLSFTDFVITDLASFPIFWIVPMFLYGLAWYLSYRQSFNNVIGKITEYLSKHQIGVFVLMIMWAMVSQNRGGYGLLFFIHSKFFLVACIGCNFLLFKTRPDGSNISLYYLCIGIGSMLGAITVPLLGFGLPSLNFLDYNTFLLLTVFFALTYREKMLEHSAKLFAGIILVAGFLVLLRAQLMDNGELTYRALMFGTIALVLAVSASHNPLQCVFASACAFAYNMWTFLAASGAVSIERSYFGKITISRNGPVVSMTHGNTNHGIQIMTPELENSPVAYYHPAGSLGPVFGLSIMRKEKKAVAVAGLGPGGIASYIIAGQDIDYYEIDPKVKDIAYKYFTYLSKCKGTANVIIGDAREKIKRATKKYGVIVLDAFGSDSIPTHLLTRNAFEDYLNVMDEDGALIVQVTNRFCNLVPMLTKIGHSLGLHVSIGDDRHMVRFFPNVMLSSTYMMFTKDQDVHDEILANSPLWHDLSNRYPYDASSDKIWVDGNVSSTDVMQEGGSLAVDYYEPEKVKIFAEKAKALEEKKKGENKRDSDEE